ncbi:predicted protein [Plenodomus lingam JN3]|uniref:Uncharacterized protein n=2 Tax=Leptosphaeria maculans TaxID=5022 RepID=E5A7G8_LEPMJ|nr:predicted protein [Plenodomus lingam JN3]CBX99563.1 predicted protein [Plenodomus lingam JN3]
MQADITLSPANFLGDNDGLVHSFMEAPPQEHILHIRYQLAPCTVSSRSPVPLFEPFHLLHCGHIVYIDGKDRRCGQNCRNISLSYSLSASNISTDPVLSTNYMHENNLYCEVCSGIPFDRYLLMYSSPTFNLPSNNPTLRRSLALTPPLLHSCTSLSNEDINASIAPLSFGQTVPGATTHTLLCGHEISGYATRPCAVNCMDWKMCRGNIVGWGSLRDTAAFLCQECIGRAELVHSRFIKSDVEMAARMAEEMAVRDLVDAGEAAAKEVAVWEIVEHGGEFSQQSLIDRSQQERKG